MAPSNEAPELFASDPQAFAEDFKSRYGIYPIAGADDGDQDQDTPQDDSTPDTDQDTSDESTDTTSEVDWSKRYNDLRPEYDRTTQQLSQYEEFFQTLQDPESRAEALAALGLELEGDEETEEDPDDYDSRFDRIESFLSQQEQAQQEAEVQELVGQLIEEQLEELDEGNEFSDEYVQLLVNSAPEDDDGVPDLAQAHDLFQKEFESQREKWVKSKRAPQAPSGGGAKHNPDLSDAEQRRDYILSRVTDPGV